MIRADFPVLLDACLLVDARVSDLYLRLSEKPRLLLPRWTDEIWNETRRTWLNKLNWPEEIANSRISAAKAAFPDAIIEGYEAIIEQCRNDTKDRHVLAAAIFGKIDTIVTFNTRHFQPNSLEPWGVVAVTPGLYLTTLWEHDPVVVQDKMRIMADRAGVSFEGLLKRLAQSVPDFVRKVADELQIDITSTQSPK